MTVTETARLLGTGAAEAYARLAREGIVPPAGAVDEVRRLVLALPGYR